MFDMFYKRLDPKRYSDLKVECMNLLSKLINLVAINPQLIQLYLQNNLMVSGVSNRSTESCFHILSVGTFHFRSMDIVMMHLGRLGKCLSISLEHQV